jgi:hypothetical protein
VRINFSNVPTGSLNHARSIQKTAEPRVKLSQSKRQNENR